MHLDCFINLVITALIVTSCIGQLSVVVMSEENSWRTSLPSSSTGTGDQTVVRPDSLTIGSTAISMDILTPQLLQFIQSCQNTAGSATSTPDNKVLDGFIPQLTKSFADATVAASSTNVDLTTPSTTITGTGVGAAGGVQSASTTTTSGLLPQNSFIISTAGGLTDGSGNSQNYILISPIAAAAATSSPNTSQLVLPNSASSVAAVARNIMNDPSAVAKTTALDVKPDIGGDLHQDMVSSSTTSNAGMHDNSSLLDSDTNRPTRPSSSDSSLHGGASSLGRRRLTALSSRPLNTGDATSTQMNRLEQKRARNRDAARRCRERKIRLIETLEKKVTQLSETNRQLKMELEQTQNEVDCLRQFVEQHFKPMGAGGCSMPLKG
nr:Basic leucine zipper (bZIP) transcription factor [Hymenolepis microstoma]